jgi:nitrogen fixation protein NifB
VAVRANTRRRFGEPENPGRALGVPDVLQRLDRVLADTSGGAALSAAVISGPGEPLADPAAVLETLRGVRAKHPHLTLSLVTNGLCAQDVDIFALAGELAEAGLSKVTVLVDAVDPGLLALIYAWIRPGKRTVPLPEASVLLVDAQARALRAFREAGLVVSARMTLFPGINENHVEEVASVVAALGADLLDLAPCRAALAPVAPVAPATGCAPSECAACGTASTCASKAPAPEPEIPESAPLPGLAPGQLELLRQQAARYIPLTPGDDPCGEDIAWMEHAGSSALLSAGNPGLPGPSGARVNVAVASSGGMEADLHLGQAIKFLIFGPRPGDGLPCLLGLRDAPDAAGPGGGDARWLALAETLHDCCAVLAASAGARPREVLAGQGISVLTAETDIQGAVDLLFGGGKRGKGNGKKRIKAN